MFRGLISDFGVAGSVIFMYLAGLVCHAAYFALGVARRPVISTCIYIFMFGFIYTSFIISVFIWNTFVAAFGLTCLVCLANAFIDRRRKAVISTTARRPSRPYAQA
jgi:hypothetical protein